MFTVAAFLPFLPLIEDAMIKQLVEDRNPQNQQRASMFLHKVMRENHVPHSHLVLMKILSKAEAKEREIQAKVDNMIEVGEDQKDRDKIRGLFENNRYVALSRSPLPQISVLYVQTKGNGKLDDETWGRLTKLCGRILCKADRWGMRQLGKIYIIVFPINKLTGDDIYTLTSLSEQHEHGEFILKYRREVPEDILRLCCLVRKTPRRKE
jgi:hypothetical protein